MRNHHALRLLVCTAVVILLPGAMVVATGTAESADGPTTRQEITLYSGRGESLVAPLIERFESQTGIRVNVRYAGTSELAVLLAEEGARTPADIFWGQDAGALGALSSAGLLMELPADLLTGKPDIYRSATGEWVATSGRARVLAYSPDRVEEADYPRSVFDLSESRYRGRVGWAPTNGSFQAFVTAMRVAHGDLATAAWLEAMRANGAQAYRNNTALVEAIAAGEIDFALTNNYYLLRFQTNDPNYPVAQRFFADGDIGNLVNVAGLAVLRTSRRAEPALEFARFLLTDESQAFFTGTVHEYPVISEVAPDARLESFARVLDASPRINLDALEDLEGTLALLRRTGLL